MAANGGPALDGQTSGGSPDGMRSALPVMDDAARSPDPSVCPFLRREADGLLTAPYQWPDTSNSCVAIGAPRQQAPHQQELVCLRDAHGACPRYLRGMLVAPEAQPPRRPASVPRATLAALLVLVLSAGISFGFVLQRGGIDLPVVEGRATPSAVAAVATPTIEPTGAATISPAPSPTPGPAPSATPEITPSPTPQPTTAPTPPPTTVPTPSPTRRPVATPAPDRYAYLVPCPDKSGCFVYTVRRGNSMWSISNYFEIPLSTLYAWNPSYANGTGLRVGDLIRMPPPPR